MTKHRKQRNALFASVLALVLCCTMLIGTTYAWFTDSVSSAGNIIKSGTLNIDLGIKAAADADYVSVKTDPTKKAFDYDKWEPGYTDWVNAKVYTTGNLALKYTMRIVANSEVSALADVIDVYYKPEQVDIPAARDLSGLTLIGTLKDAIDGNVVIDDTLIPDLSLYNGTATTEASYATIALHMQETAGNEYQDLSIGTDFSIQILATQYTYEADSFDDQYDAPPVEVEEIALDKTELLVEMGSTATLTATVSPDNATDKNVTWTSSDEAVATVDENGVVSPLGAGQTVITATANGKSASCNVTVYDPDNLDDIADVATQLSVDGNTISPENELMQPVMKSTYAVINKSNSTLKDLIIKANSNAANGGLTLNGAGNTVTNVVIDQVDGSGSTLIMKGSNGGYTVTNSTLTHGSSGSSGRYGALYFEGATINDQNTAKATVTTVDNVNIGLAYDREAMIERYVAMGAAREDLEAALPENAHDLGSYLMLFRNAGGLIYHNFGGTLNVTNTTIDTPYSGLKAGFDSEPRYGWVNVTDSTINTTNIGFERVDYTTFKNVTFKNDWTTAPMQISTGSSYQGNLNYTFEDCTFDLSGLNLYLSSTGTDSVHNPKMTFKNCTVNGVAVTADNYSEVIGSFLTFSTNQTTYTGQIQNLAYDADTNAVTFTVARVAK